MMPKVGIIILHWNGKDDTIACLESLQRLDYPDYQIILVDNGSIDDFTDIAPTSFPTVHLLKNQENLGFAKGNNLGIHYALSQNCAYVLLLNNDTIVEPLFLQQLIRVGEQYPNIGMLSPLIYFYDQPDALWSCGGEINWKNGYADNMTALVQKRQEYFTDCDFLSGCALLVKVEVIREIGLLDERFFAYYEDTDWSVRCKRAHWEIAVVPSAKVWHKIVSSGRSDYRQFLTYRNATLFLWKHSNILQFPLRMKRHIYRVLSIYSWDREKYHASPLNLLDGLWAGLTGHYGSRPTKMPLWMRHGIYRYIRCLLWIFRYP